MQKRSWTRLDGLFLERQRQKSDLQCACGCGQFISNRAKKAKLKGFTDGYVKGHTWKGRKMPKWAKEKMSLHHADVSGKKNPNYGKGLFGADNPNWQGGKVIRFYNRKNQPQVNTLEDRAFKKRIKQRDKRCVLCGSTIKLNTHHIDSWVEQPDFRFAVNNCVILCKRCHVRADNKHHKHQIKPMLKAYLESFIPRES